MIPNFWSKRSCLTLVYVTLLTAAKNWRGVRITPVIQQELADLRAEYQPAIEQAVAWRGMMNEKAAPPGTNLQEKWGLTSW